MVIINADDFGLNSSVNHAIVESFERNYITSTTIMANMPGFEEAVSLAKENKLTGKIGIHLNLTQGIPLTENILSSNLFYNKNNTDLKKHKRRLFFLSKKEKEIIFKEFSAQVEKVRNAGIEITHIDSHHHIHEVWPVTKLVLALLKKYQIPSMRILNNLNQSTGFHKLYYRNFVNNRIKSKEANLTGFFGSQLQTFAQLKKNPSVFNDAKLEMMVHPDYNNSGILVDKIKDREYYFEYPDDFKKLISLNNQLKSA